MSAVESFGKVLKISMFNIFSLYYSLLISEANSEQILM